jgi:hypothetical protein
VVVAFPVGQAHFSGEMGATGATTGSTSVVVAWSVQVIVS